MDVPYLSRGDTLGVHELCSSLMSVNPSCNILSPELSCLLPWQFIAVVHRGHPATALGVDIQRSTAVNSLRERAT